ncbi:MAG: LysM peptidoglycan-binding domain-containing protein [Jannaschia sp.]
MRAQVLLGLAGVAALVLGAVAFLSVERDTPVPGAANTPSAMSDKISAQKTVEIEQPPFASTTEGASMVASATDEPMAIPSDTSREALAPVIDDFPDTQATPSPQVDPASPRLDPLPTLDVVRVGPDGSALVAGSGAADADVTVRLDGVEIAAIRTDRAGQFVSLFDLPATNSTALLTVESMGSDGLVHKGEDSVIVVPKAPTLPPPDIAAAANIPAQTSDPVIVPDAVPDIASASRGTRPAPVPNPTAPEPTASATVSTIADPVTAMASMDMATAATRQSGGTVQAPRLFRAGPDGIAVLPKPPTSPEPASDPVVVEDLGIDAISYDAVGDVQLTGRAARDTELRIYLDNRPVRTVLVDGAGGWTSPLPDVDSGIYTLRIDAVAADGTVTERVETPFRRSAPEIAAQARRDGLTAITVQPGYTLWAISEGYFGEGIQYVQIFEVNRSLIRDPDLIYPGQIVALPAASGE